MANLTAREKSFVDMMETSDEHMRKGFELILRRPGFVKYFDTLKERGFFGADRNPAPVHVGPEDHYQIPYWKALDYLVECARWADEKNDPELAKNVMGIVRSVSLGSASSDAHDNYHTYLVFAEIVGLIPIECVRAEDLVLVEGWLSTRFDRSLVVHTLDGGVLRRLLDSEEPSAWEKAVQLIGYCTAVRWQCTQYGSDDEQPRGVVDEYYLKEIVDHHAPSLGKRVGRPAAELFAHRVREVFGRGGRAKWSHVFRAAVEENGQNSEGRSIENCVVVGLRDLLLAWCDHESDVARCFVENLLQDGNEMCRRIAIFVLNRQWDSLRPLYRPIAVPEFLSGGHLHELYGLIRDHFHGFNDCEKALTIDAIRNLPRVERVAPELHERFQHRWLSATAGTNYGPAAKWLAQLDDKYARDRNHPDYLSYSETRWGPGPSKYSAQELVEFARERTIVTKLIQFKPGDMWSGPTVEGLIDELERAVSLSPDQFVYTLQEFIDAPRDFQYGLIHGFLKLWQSKNASTIDWDGIWSHLVKFFKQLLQDQRLWKIDDDNPGLAQPSWISNAVSDLLIEGTRDDKRAYPSALLPNGWDLIQILVDRGERLSEPIDDPMNQSINSSKGRALQAAFGHILRRCRLADKETGCHATVWSEMRWLLDRELDQCVGGNFEFSTLCGARLGNLAYIDEKWLEANIEHIFPSGHPTNLRCAVGGLAYASADRRTYRMLRDKGVIDRALGVESQDRYGREKLMERLMLGYLWEEESLQSSRFSHLFCSARPADFESIYTFFNNIRRDRENLNPEQAKRIVDYWRYCVTWAQRQKECPVWLLSGLSVLTSFLTTADGCRDLLLAVAPHVRVHHETYEFIGELDRLFGKSPAEVRDTLERFVETHEPFYDYEGRMLALIRRLAELDEYREDAIRFCEKLRSMAGMETLFNELTVAV